MDRIVLIVLVLVVGVVGLFVGSRWSKGYDFHEIDLNGQRNVLLDLEKRTSMKPNTTSQDGLLGVVGTIFVVDKTKTKNGAIQFDQTNIIPLLRPSSETILVSPVNKTLYEGKISNKVDAGGSFTSFTADLSNSQTADIIIIDELYMGYRDRTKIPFKNIYELKVPADKAFYFVESATITSTTYRTYDEVTSTGTLDGAAFKAKGKVFISSKSMGYAVTLSVDAFDVQALRAAEGGAGDAAVSLLYRQHEKGQLDKDGADKLVQLLNAHSDSANMLKGAKITSLGK